jgi:hypothetical protein
VRDDRPGQAERGDERDVEAGAELRLAGGPVEVDEGKDDALGHRDPSNCHQYTIRYVAVTVKRQ